MICSWRTTPVWKSIHTRFSLTSPTIEMDGPSVSGGRISARRRPRGGTAWPVTTATRSSASNGRFSRGADVLELLLDAVGGGIELERLLPRAGRVLVEAVLEQRVAQVFEDDRVLAGLLDRALQLAERVGILALLVVGPAEAVDEVAVLGLERDRLGDQLDRLVEVLPALGVHVADVVVGLRVLGIERDDLAELADGVVELRLLLVDDAELEVKVLLLLVEGQPFLQGLGGGVVLLGTEVRGGQGEEEVGPLGMQGD